MRPDKRGGVRAVLKNLLRLLAIIAAAFLLNAVILLCLGKNVGQVYETLFTGAFAGKWNFARTLRWTSPLPVSYTHLTLPTN